MQPLSSATTGALAVVTQRASVGHERGTTGSSKSLIASEGTAREWLLRQATPEAADAALLRSLTSTLSVTARPETEWRFPEGKPAYSIVRGFTFDIADREQIRAALDKISQAMTPATPEQCEGWLVMLQAATARRADTEATTAVSYALYASELRQWPADVAKAACERLARGRPDQSGTNWFPTLAELVAECERLAQARRSLFVCLQREMAKPAVEQQPRREPTSGERVAVHRMAQEAMVLLQERAAVSKAVTRPPPPSTAGKPDEGGLTPQMREYLSKRQAEKGW